MMLTQEDEQQIAAIVSSILSPGGHYAGPERRANPIPEEVIEQIAERAAERALNHVYTAIGKSFVTKALWLVGAACCSLAAWLAGSGHFNG